MSNLEGDKEMTPDDKQAWDNKHKRHLDKYQISCTEDYEIDRLAKKLGTTPEVIKEIVKKIKSHTTHKVLEYYFAHYAK